MGLANKSVVLYQSIKIGSKWILCPVDEDSSHFSKGPFYVSWYDGKKKQMDPVGRDPEHALRMALRKRAALAYAAAGGEVKNSDPVQGPVRTSTEVEDKTTPVQNSVRESQGGAEKNVTPVPNSVMASTGSEEKNAKPAQNPHPEQKSVKPSFGCPGPSPTDGGRAAEDRRLPRLVGRRDRGGGQEARCTAAAQKGASAAALPPRGRSRAPSPIPGVPR